MGPSLDDEVYPMKSTIGTLSKAIVLVYVCTALINVSCAFCRALASQLRYSYGHVADRPKGPFRAIVELRYFTC
jgi:hypothetical protein